MLPESQIVAGAVYQGSRQVNPGRWSGQVVPRWRPPQGLFAKGSAQQIARAALHGHHGDAGSAIRALQFYLNRAGRNLSAARRRAVEGAKRALQRANPHVDAEACHEQAEVAREWAELCASRGYLMNPHGQGHADLAWISGVLVQFMLGAEDPEANADPDVPVLLSMAGFNQARIRDLLMHHDVEDRVFWVGEILNGLRARGYLSVADADLIGDHVMGRPYEDPGYAQRVVEQSAAGRLAHRLNPALALVGNPHQRPSFERFDRGAVEADVVGPSGAGTWDFGPIRVWAGRWRKSPGRYVVHVEGFDMESGEKLAEQAVELDSGVAAWRTDRRVQVAVLTVARETSARRRRGNPALALVGNGPAPIAKQRRSLPKGPKVPNAGGGNRLLKKGRKGFKLFHGREPGVYWVFTPPNKWRKATKAEVANWQGEVAIGLGAVPETHYMVPQAWKSSKGPHYYVHEHPEGKEPLEVKLASNGLTMKLPTSPDMKIEDWWYE